jgi:hypothetical protein
MKKAFITLLATAFAFLSFAQPPQYINYQASVRDGEGTIVANQEVSFKIEILSGSASGTVVYRETHIVTTNDQGLVDLKIFGGDNDGSWSPIDWSAADYFLKVYLDLAGGTDFVEMGTSQMLSVPYAFHAGTVATEKQELSVSGEQLSISGGNTVDLPEQYVSFQTLGSLKVGTGGVDIGEIIEVKGTTSESASGITIDLPEGFTQSNTRILSLEITVNLLPGVLQSCGLGFTRSTGTVSYNTFYQSAMFGNPARNGINISYPDDLRGFPFRIIMMKKN